MVMRCIVTTVPSSSSSSSSSSSPSPSSSSSSSSSPRQYHHNITSHLVRSHILIPNTDTNKILTSIIANNNSTIVAAMFTNQTDSKTDSWRVSRQTMLPDTAWPSKSQSMSDGVALTVLAGSEMRYESSTVQAWNHQAKESYEANVPSCQIALLPSGSLEPQQFLHPRRLRSDGDVHTATGLWHTECGQDQGNRSR